MKANKTASQDAQDRLVCADRLTGVLRCIDGRWKMPILAQLCGHDVLRFSDLQRAIPQASQKMLTQHLRELERDGVVARTVYPEVPPKVEYRLTDLGKGLRPVFGALADWADRRNAQAGIRATREFAGTSSGGVARRVQELQR